MIKRNRVVITGMGVVAPNGIGLDAFWDSLLHCRSGIGPITLFDASKFKSRIAGEVKNFNPLDYIEPELKPKRMGRHTQLAHAAAVLALQDAGFDPEDPDLPSPTPVIIGVSTSAIDVLERVFRAVQQYGPSHAPPSALASSNPQAAANTIAGRIGAKAHSTTISSACPSGLDAVAKAAEIIRSGEAELAIAGGADAPVTPITVASFIEGGLSCATNGDDPTRVSRPFDRNRKSGVLAEGAAVVILESMERAEARSGKVYAEITGYGTQRDLDPSQPASGLADSMTIAIANAGIGTEDISYICAYGPSDPILDAMEVRAIKKVFGRRAYDIPVSSIKGVTGNPLAAGGPLQLAASAMMLRHQIIVPTANLETRDPDCDLDFVPLTPRRQKLERIIINVRGLGGSASSIVLSQLGRT